MPRNRDREIKEGIRERREKKKNRESKSFSHTLLVFSFGGSMD